MPTERKNKQTKLLQKAKRNRPKDESRIRRLAPRGLAENKKGAVKAGNEYFHACIIARNGFPSVTAAAAEGERPTGGGMLPLP